MSGNTNAVNNFITFPFQVMKPLQELGLPGSIVLVTAIADAAIQYFVDRNITTFQFFFTMRNIKFLPTFNANAIAGCIRIGALYWSYEKLLLGIFRNKTIDKINYRIVVQLAIVGNMSMPYVLLSAFIIEQLNNFRIQNKNLGKDDPSYQNELKKVNLSWHKFSNERGAQLYAFMQATLNIALVFFLDSKLFFAALAALNLYVFAQITKRDWLQIARTIGNIRYTYNAIFPLDVTLKDDICAVCQDTPSHKYYFCPNHSYDLPCLIRLFISATDHFKIQSASIQKSDPVERVVITFDANESIKPRCPMCKLPSSYNSLSMEVYYDDRWWDASVNWIKSVSK